MNADDYSTPVRMREVTPGAMRRDRVQIDFTDPENETNVPSTPRRHRVLNASDYKTPVVLQRYKTTCPDAPKLKSLVERRIIF